MIRVMIVDDQPTVRRSLRLLLRRPGDIVVVGEATSGPEAVDMAPSILPDVVLMDVRMPSGDGIAATRALSQRPLDLPVIVITTFDVDDYLFGAIDAGAVGFLLKTSPSSLYVDAIRAAAAGDGVVSPEVTPRLLAALATRGDGRSNAALEDLTARETDVVRALANGHSSTTALAAQLHISPQSVKGHLKRIMAKLDVESRAEIVTWAFRNGVVS